MTVLETNLSAAVCLNRNWPTLIDNAEYISIDTETNGLDPFRFPDKVRMNGFSICVRVGDKLIADYFPVAHTNEPEYNLPEKKVQYILNLIFSGKHKLIFHNSIFDLRIVELYRKKKYTGLFYDTMKIAHLINENYGKVAGGYSLDSCCERFLGHKGKVKSPEFELALAMFGWGGLSYTDIEEYAREDAHITYQLFEAETKKLKSEPKIPKYFQEIEAPNHNVLKEMRVLGVKVNQPLTKELSNLAAERMEAVEAELDVKFSGKGSQAAVKHLFYETLNLPVILNKQNRPTLDKDAMERYDLMLEERNDPTAQKLLEFRGWQKAKSAFYDPYLALVDNDGRIRTDFKPHGTVTGRFSSSKPNLQQIPKESTKPWNGRVKECFQAESGYELWEFDYSQLEFRLAAMYAREPKLIDVFNDDSRDIFNEMSADLSLERQKCKTLTYSIQYGAGSQRIMDVFNYTKPKAIGLINQWYDNYPGIKRVSAQAKAMAASTGKIEIWSGRYRHFKFPRSESRKAFNSAIQGGAADIVKKTMNTIAKEMPELRMILQVHDALWFEIPKHRVEFYKPQIRKIMETPFNNSLVHFKVDGHLVGSEG